MTETLYHIYLNDDCIVSCLSESQFEEEYKNIKNFLELTRLNKSAKLEYVRCEPPAYADASY